jgi:hypothetical protein
MQPLNISQHLQLILMLLHNSITISMTGSSSTVWFYFLTDRQVSLEVNKVFYGQI